MKSSDTQRKSVESLAIEIIQLVLKPGSTIIEAQLVDDLSDILQN
jgi:DNA-binding GntR family transcriptional regulator